MIDSDQGFGRARAWLFPIQTRELKTFLPMGLMMFFVLFNYTVLRDVKDTLVVGAAGGEALSLIKLIGTVPGAVAIMLVYAKLSQVFSRRQMFYIAVVPFMLFFGLFALVIYPNLSSLHPSASLVEKIASDFPRFKTLAHVWGNWSYALFYVLAELWGSVILSLLFWQTANDIVAMKQAKRFYPLFGVIANFGAIGAGLALSYFSRVRQDLPAGMDPWGLSLNYLMGAVVLSCLGLMLTYWWISSTNELPEAPLKQKKQKMSLTESFRYLIRSKHLGCISLLVICYGISINVVEAVWKNEIKFVYGNLNDYSAFMGNFSIYMGLVTIAFMFLGGMIVRKFGWFVSASLTPIMIMVSGLLFFAFVSFKDALEPYTLSLLAAGPSVIAVWLGFGQNIMSKATKYSLFDPTKEMSYIPLDEESKLRGKAAVDVVGARLGKSGGALIQQAFLFGTGLSLAELSPYLGAVVLIVVGAWLMAASALDKSIKGRAVPLQAAV